jgi:hypothetical protein
MKRPSPPSLEPDIIVYGQGSNVKPNVDGNKSYFICRWVYEGASYVRELVHLSSAEPDSLWRVMEERAKSWRVSTGGAAKQLNAPRSKSLWAKTGSQG